MLRNKNFRQVLQSNQAAIYDRLSNERRNLCLKGLVLGFGVASLFAASTTGLNKQMRACAFVFITLGIHHLFYQVAPKSDYILNHLDSGTQIQRWVQNYVADQRAYHLGTLGAAVLYLGFVYAFKM